MPTFGTATAETMGDLSNPMVMRTYYSRLFPFKQLFTWLNQGYGSLLLSFLSILRFVADPGVPVQLPRSSGPTANSLSPSRTKPTFVTRASTPSRTSRRRSSGSTRLVSKLDPSTADGRVPLCPPLLSNFVAHLFSPTAKRSQGSHEVRLPSFAARARLRYRYDRLFVSRFLFLSSSQADDLETTDDSVRTCCKDKAMCKRCWRFITVAVKVLDELLRGSSSLFHRSDRRLPPLSPTEASPLPPLSLRNSQRTSVSSTSSGFTPVVEEFICGSRTLRRWSLRTTNEARSCATLTSSRATRTATSAFSSSGRCIQLSSASFSRPLSFHSREKNLLSFPHLSVQASIRQAFERRLRLRRSRRSRMLPRREAVGQRVQTDTGQGYVRPRLLFPLPRS